jgi:hypothetical protein
MQLILNRLSCDYLIVFKCILDMLMLCDLLCCSCIWRPFIRYYFHRFWVLELLWESTICISSMWHGDSRSLSMIAQYESPPEENIFVDFLCTYRPCWPSITVSVSNTNIEFVSQLVIDLCNAQWRSSIMNLVQHKVLKWMCRKWNVKI